MASTDLDGAPRGVVAVDASAGGVEALTRFVAGPAPDPHLLIADGRSVLSDGPIENGYRPTSNALFRSAALSFGLRSIGVLLSGVLDDGVLGTAAIRARGGKRYSQVADEAERALTILGKWLSVASSVAGEHGGG
jgi:two-component system, chemotaxis family, protein-glutamate methylesterase/glutaminase